MTPNEQISELYKRHKIWVGFAKKYLFNTNQIHAEDIVMECYIKILKYLHKHKGKKINDMYMLRTIRSMINDMVKLKSNPLKDASRITDYHEEKEEPKADPNEILQEIDNLVETFYHFDKLLFNAYRYEFRSIRKLSKATKIGHVQVFQTVKRCKEKINDKLKYKYYGKE